MPEQSPPKSVSEKNQAWNAESKSSKESDQTESKVPVSSAPVKPNRQESPYHCEVTHKTEKNWWDKLKPFVEIAGIGLLALYTAYTIKIYRANSDYVNIAQKTFEASQRPYVGVDKIDRSFTKKLPSGQEIQVGQPDKDTHWLNLNAEIKNFGPVPGTNYEADWRVFVGGIEQGVSHKEESKPTTIFPGQVNLLVGEIGSNDYPSVMDGTKILIVETFVSYDGPSAHYEDCNKQQFVPSAKAFANLGPCKWR